MIKNASLRYRKRMVFPFRLLLASCTMCLAADPVLDLTLNDPNGLITSNGVAALSPAMTSATATIASGNGGRAQLVLDAGTGGTPPTFNALSDAALGPFLQMSQPAGSSAKNIGVAILPTSGATSLSAIYQGNNTLDGGFDFFFRLKKDSIEGLPRVVFHSRLGPFEIGLKPSAKQDGIEVTFLTKEAILERVDTKAGPKPNVAGKIVNPVPIESGELYHLAVLCKTSGDGVVSIQVFLDKGVGEIRPDASTGLNASLDFKITKTAAESPVVGRSTLVLGTQEFAQTLDVAQFRIYAPAPKIFPALTIKK
ncbi:hypothetical protein BH09VER1_BH09VER1_03820 [soil metagenome]